MKTGIRSWILWLLIASLAIPACPARAELISTPLAVASDRERIAAVLAREDVRGQLVARGVDRAHVQARVAALSDHEAAVLASELDKLPAGGRAESIVVVILAVLFYAVILAVAVVAFAGFLIVKGVSALAKGNGSEAEAPAGELPEGPVDGTPSTEGGRS